MSTLYRKKQECNGRKNWDTWNVGVIIVNDKSAYDFVKKNKQKLLLMKKNEKLDAINRASRVGFGRINKKYVDYRELNEIIKSI